MALPAARQSQPLEEGLKLTSFCPTCQNSFAPRETHVLSDRLDGHVLHVRCGWCENSTLTSVLSSLAGISTNGWLTDLSHDEVFHFQTAAAVTTDDVIEMHCLLEQEDELFSRLFA